VGDFVIDPEKNYGVSHAFSEVVRGKDMRKSLTAAPCPDCAKVHSLTLRFDVEVLRVTWPVWGQ
jgi:hypothetical protein